MKILLSVHHHLDINAGASGCTLKIGQAYQQLGHEVEYYSFDDLPPKLPALSKVVLFPEFVAGHLARRVREDSIDVINASTGDAWVWAKFLRQNRCYPLLVTQSHGLEHALDRECREAFARGQLKSSWKYPLYHGGFRLWEVEESLRHADLVFMLNSNDRTFAIEQLRVGSDRIKIIPNGIPESFLNLPLEPIPEKPDAMIGIAQIGTFIQRKGIHYSVPALNAVLRRYPQVKVTLLGTDCPEAPPANAIVAQFDPAVRARLQVIPRYDHTTLPTLLQGHHIKLFPSLAEGFGLALLEAMACGLAPVTTASAGPTEIIRDGQDALVIPFRDSQAIEKALEKLICDHSLLNRLRRNAYETAQRYSWIKIAQTRLSLYQELLDKKRSHQKLRCNV